MHAYIYVLLISFHEALYNWGIALADMAKETAQLQKRGADSTKGLKKHSEYWKMAISKYTAAVKIAWRKPQAHNNLGLAIQVQQFPSNLQRLFPYKKKLDTPSTIFTVCIGKTGSFH